MLIAHPEHGVDLTKTHQSIPLIAELLKSIAR
jgi:hypothetical protein